MGAFTLGLVAPDRHRPYCHPACSAEGPTFARLSSALALTALVVVLAGAALAPSDAGAEQAGSKVNRRASGFLAAGARFSCARLDTGRVRCWGRGSDGALGYGNPNDVGDNETPASVGPVDLGAGTNGARHRRRLLSRLRDPRPGPGALLGQRPTSVNSATATGTPSATTRRRARWGRWTSVPGERRSRSPAGGRPHLRDPRQRQGALLGLRLKRPARLRQQEGHRRQRDAGLGWDGRPRRGTNGGGDRGRRPSHLRDPRQRQGRAAGAMAGRASSATGTRGTSATTRRPPRSGP